MKASRQKYQQSLEMIQQILSGSTSLLSRNKIASKAVLPAPITMNRSQDSFTFASPFTGIRFTPSSTW